MVLLRFPFAFLCCFFVDLLAFGCLGGPFFGVLGGVWGYIFGVCGPQDHQEIPKRPEEGVFGAIFGSLVGWLWPTWGHFGPTWCQLGPTWGQLGPTWGQLGPTWANLGPTWGQLGAKLTPRFPSFFRLREASWSELGPKLAPSWPKLEASSAKLGPRCAMLAPSWPKLAPSWANLGQLGLQSWIFETF